MTGRCTACGEHGVCDRAHFKTRGSGATWGDSEWMLLCRKHHIQQGAYGWAKFLKLYPKVKDEMTAKGWGLQEIFGVMKLVKLEVEK